MTAPAQMPSEPPTADDIEQCAAHLERLAIEYDKEQAEHTEGWQAAQWLRYLQAECERLRGTVRYLEMFEGAADYAKQVERAESAERKLAEKDAALKKYGKHHVECDYYDYDITVENLCTCGFDEALKGTT